MDSQTAPAPKFHYFLASAEIEYLPYGMKDSFRYKKANTVVSFHSRDLNVKALGKIQVALQQAFHQKHSRIVKRAPEITDVVILEISYLGEFTEAEFQPEDPKPKAA